MIAPPDPADVVDPCAQRVIDRCGGIRALAKATGLHPSGIYRWVKPVASQRGHGGIIPGPSRQRLREAMRQGLIPITPADLLEVLPE